MFDINWIDRDMTRDQWNKLRNSMRKNGTWYEYVTPGQGGYLAARAKTAATLSKYTNEDGEVGVVESGRDCDCVEFVHGSKYRFSGVVAFERHRDHAYEWADGPLWVTLCPVEDLPRSHSRDLALEAFEDGHAHSVSSVRYDEDGDYHV